MSTQPVRRRKKVQVLTPLEELAGTVHSTSVQKTLTRVKIEKIDPTALKKPIDTVALDALKIFAKEHESLRVFYSNTNLPFSARRDFIDYSTTFFSNENFYLKWIKVSAQMVDREIKLERELKAKKKFWAAIKERFRAELKALHTKKAA